uniref:Potassium channel, subfamily K, member 17 n=1 Tax=Nothobranchius kuhntae TaxID=321403 RepID=A0A1A8I8X3_NOTKU
MASWIFFGLAWLALLINHSIDILERLNAFFKQQCCGKKPAEESNESESKENNPHTQEEEVEEIKETPISQ